MAATSTPTSPKPSSPNSSAAPATLVASAAANHVIADSEDGRLTVQHGVVAKIVGLAVTKIDGVHALSSHGASETLARFASELTGGHKHDLGIHVDIGRTEFAADIRLVADYGAEIPRIAKEIRETVAAQVSKMTGLKLRELNIDIVDLWFGDEEPTAPRRDLK